MLSFLSVFTPYTNGIVGMPMLEIRDRILAMLESERDEMAAAVAGGASGSFEDYRHQVGLIRGLDRARTLVAEGFSRHIDEDEDDAEHGFEV